MNLDQSLVETIKRHFANKSSSHLQLVANAVNDERWSPEAVAAAKDILRDRAEGRAQEPTSPMDIDPEPYKDTYNPNPFLGSFGP